MIFTGIKWTKTNNNRNSIVLPSFIYTVITFHFNRITRPVEIVKEISINNILNNIYSIWIDLKWNVNTSGFYFVQFQNCNANTPLVHFKNKTVNIYYIDGWVNEL